MPTEKHEPTVKLPAPRFVAFFRNGIFSAEMSPRLREAFIEAEKLDHGGGGFKGIKEHGGDSPMACNTSSLFADTVDPRGWTQVGKECYTSEAKLPLFLLRFRGFDDGNYIILTDMCWSMKLRSVVNGSEGFFSVCSLPTHGLLCPLSSDRPPSRTATICALGGAHFNPEPGPPDPYKGRHRFQHQGTGGTCFNDGVLKDVTLSVGSSFSAKFTVTNPADCVVVWGVPEDHSIAQHIGELLGTE